MIDPGVGFEVNLTFNTALNLLHFRSNMSVGIARSPEFPWLLRMLSSVNTSNRIEEIILEIYLGDETFQPGDCSAWKQVDRILADTHFQFLQKLVFNIVVFNIIDVHVDEEESFYDPLDSDLVCTRIVAAFPLLVERGVSVEARPRLRECP
jgi:hypothetical protein